MRRVYAIPTLGALVLIALSLLIMWRVGIVGPDQSIPAHAHKQIKEEGLYAELEIEPEAGILTGDILQVSINVFFDHSKKSIDENLIAEKYITLKESEFAGCEEYTPPKLNRKKIGEITNISLHSSFQCFFTQTQEMRIHFSIQHIDLESQNTGSLGLQKTLSFASIPTDKPKGFLDHAHSQNRNAFALIILGGILLIVVPLSYVIRRKIMQRNTKEKSVVSIEENPFVRAIDDLEAQLSRNGTRKTIDRLYHICREMEAQYGLTKKLEDLTQRLLAVYAPTHIFTSREVESCLLEARKIAKLGVSKC